MILHKGKNPTKTSQNPKYSTLLAFSAHGWPCARGSTDLQGSLKPKHLVFSQYLVLSFLEVFLPILPLHWYPHTSHFLEPAWTTIFLLPHREHRSFRAIHVIYQSRYAGEKPKLGYYLLFCFFPPRALLVWGPLDLSRRALLITFLRRFVPYSYPVTPLFNRL